jgi:hypothetical protein
LSIANCQLKSGECMSFSKIGNWQSAIDNIKRFTGVSLGR